MTDNLVRGYKHIGRPRGDFISANGLNHVSPPVDKQNRIFAAMVLAGIGFLLPYNSFILAVDFFQDRYPNTTIMFDMSMVYIITAFFAVLLNNILVEMLSLNTRITFGYAVSLITLLFVAFCEIDMEAFTPAISYKINLVAVGAVAVGCTVQQSSYYGFTSMLPTRYTQAVMAGESAAGVWVSANRILTKLLLQDEKKNTEVFFGLTLVTLCVCWALYVVVRKTAFVEFYITLCQESRRKIVLEPTEDAGLMDMDTNDTPKGQYGVLKLQISPPPDTCVSLNSDESLAQPAEAGQFSAFSFSNPVYEPTSNGLTSVNTNNVHLSGPSFKVEDVLVRTQSTGSSRGKTWAGIKGGIRARWLVAQQIYPYMVFIALAYFVTLCLYPGILSEIVSCRFGSWMPVILMAIFNLGDLIGKMFATRVSEWARSKLAACCSLRLLLLPLTLLCCAPRGSPHVAAAGDAAPAILALLLGATGGALGAAPMLAAAQRVRNDARELAGNIMTLSYNVGLTAGSLVAYVLDAMLGPQVADPCGAVYPTIGPMTKAITTTLAANLTTFPEFTTTVATAVTAVINATIISAMESTVASGQTVHEFTSSMVPFFHHNTTSINDIRLNTHEAVTTVSWLGE